MRCNIYLSIHPSIYLSIYLSIHTYVYVLKRYCISVFLVATTFIFISLFCYSPGSLSVLRTLRFSSATTSLTFAGSSVPLPAWSTRVLDMDLGLSANFQTKGAGLLALLVVILSRNLELQDNQGNLRELAVRAYLPQLLWDFWRLQKHGSIFINPGPKFMCIVIQTHSETARSWQPEPDKTFQQNRGP